MRARGLLLAGVVLLVAAVYFAGPRTDSRAAPERSARLVYLKSGDVAVFGKVQCIANAEAGARSLLCQRRPRRRARYEVAVSPTSILVFKMGNPDPVYVAR